jgi:DNA-binding NtrC family response regulator
MRPWTTPFTPPLGAITGTNAAVAPDGTIYFGARGADPAGQALYALTVSGQEKWRVSTGASYIAPIERSRPCFGARTAVMRPFRWFRVASPTTQSKDPAERPRDAGDAAPRTPGSSSLRATQCYDDAMPQRASPPEREWHVAAGGNDLKTRVMGDAQAAAARVTSAEIVVIDGPDGGKRFTLSTEGAKLGTAPGSQMRLNDSTVSRIHCELSLVPGGVRLVDSGSTNGTFLDGHRVRDVDLHAGATVRVGATVLRVSLGEDSITIPLSQRDSFGGVIGRSVEMRHVYALMDRSAATNATVLLRGETGTGKELVARAIHDASKRARAPFIAVDCGAIAPNVIESELFGHVRGAFSGAVSDRRGLFEEADGGTLFLDEIGELPIALQAKLLRALEMLEVRPVGGNTVRKLDVRIFAATNRPLSQAVNEGAFREDLYYRLAVVEIQLPPLRTRREDIPLLAQHFYSRFTEDSSPIPPDLLSALMTRSWPGNVRELRNVVERQVTLGWGAGGVPPAGNRRLLPSGIEAFVPVAVPLKQAREAWIEEFEGVYVRALLRKTSGNVTRAAETAGVSRRFLQRTMARLGIRVDEALSDGD